MPKTPQDYWEEVHQQLPTAPHGLEDVMENVLRVAFFYGVASTLNFIESLAAVSDKPAAFRTFCEQVDMQRLVEKARHTTGAGQA